MLACPAPRTPGLMFFPCMRDKSTWSRRSTSVISSVIQLSQELEFFYETELTSSLAMLTDMSIFCAYSSPVWREKEITASRFCLALPTTVLLDGVRYFRAMFAMSTSSFLRRSSSTILFVIQTP